MDTYQIEIIEPGVKKLLDDLANMNLITVHRIDVEGPNGNGFPVSRREDIMSLAGTWDSMSEGDFQDYLSEAKRSGGEMFDRDVSLLKRQSSIPTRSLTFFAAMPMLSPNLTNI